MKTRLITSLLFCLLTTSALFAASAKTASTKTSSRQPAARTSAAASTAADAAALKDAEVLAVGFSPGNAEQLVLGVINNAKTELRVCAYVFTSRKISNALVAARQRGVDVAVVADLPMPSQRQRLRNFFEKNQLPHRLNASYATMHNKFIVADRKIVQTGSFNYTIAAATNNAENVLVLRGEGIANVYLREWQRLWNEAPAER